MRIKKHQHPVHGKLFIVVEREEGISHEVTIVSMEPPWTKTLLAHDDSRSGSTDEMESIGQPD